MIIINYYYHYYYYYYYYYYYNYYIFYNIYQNQRYLILFISHKPYIRSHSKTSLKNIYIYF